MTAAARATTAEAGAARVAGTVKAEPDWGQSLYTGAAGIALCHLQHARTGSETWETAHHWVRAMTRHPITAHPDTTGLHHGAPAVAFTLHAADQPAYADVLRRLDGHITTLTRHRLAQAQARIDAGQRPRVAEYDLVRGLTGIGVYLLHRHTDGEQLRDLLTYFVRLTHLITLDGMTLPGWWARHGPTDRPSGHWPGGHANLGMAHGIAGPLALLATALRHGITVPGHVEAIVRICAWLDRWQTGTGRSAWWPGLLSIAEHRSGANRHPGPQRPSWCYGTPGIARAQQLAALALGDQARQLAAEQALAGCLADPAQLAQLDGTGLCHGWAGLLQTTRRVAADATDPDLFDLPGLAQRLQHHLDQHGPPQEPCLLNGWAGVRLVHHALDSSPFDSRWDACLLLDDGPPRPAPATERTS